MAILIVRVRIDMLTITTEKQSRRATWAATERLRIVRRTALHLKDCERCRGGQHLRATVGIGHIICQQCVWSVFEAGFVTFVGQVLRMRASPSDIFTLPR